jgi:hypothetical protein
MYSSGSWIEDVYQNIWKKAKKFGNGEIKRASWLLARTPWIEVLGGLVKPTRSTGGCAL